MTDVTRDEVLEKLRALPEDERARVIQLALASFPELDQDGLSPSERATLDAELDAACDEADRSDTLPIEALFDKPK